MKSGMIKESIVLSKNMQTIFSSLIALEECKMSVKLSPKNVMGFINIIFFLILFSEIFCLWKCYIKKKLIISYLEKCLLLSFYRNSGELIASRA